MQERNSTTLEKLSNAQRMDVVCVTLNPLMVETAAMLFAIDIGMVIDSGVGKGRHGIDVIAVCGKGTIVQDVIERLGSLGIKLQPDALKSLIENRTIAFQCKGYDNGEIATARFVEFRPMRSQATIGRSVISLRDVLEQAKDAEKSGLIQLRGWLDRMCELVGGVPATTTASSERGKGGNAMSDIGEDPLGRLRELYVVQERDINLLLLEEMHSSPDFVHWFGQHVGLQSPVFNGAWCSVSNADGESDLLLRVLVGSERVGVLIEDKIAAGEQLDQDKRYHMRGNQEVRDK